MPKLRTLLDSPTADATSRGELRWQNARSALLLTVALTAGCTAQMVHEKPLPRHPAPPRTAPNASQHPAAPSNRAQPTPHRFTPAHEIHHQTSEQKTRPWLARVLPSDRYFAGQSVEIWQLNLPHATARTPGQGLAQFCAAEFGDADCWQAGRLALLTQQSAYIVKSATNFQKDRTYYLFPSAQAATEYVAWHTGHYHPAAYQAARCQITDATKTQNASHSYFQLAQQAAHEFDLPPDIFTALICQESRFDPHAISMSGAVGLSQMLPTAAAESGIPDITKASPEQQIRAGARYLQRWLQHFGGNMPLAIAAYNFGPGAVERAILAGVHRSAWSHITPAQIDRALAAVGRTETRVYLAAIYQMAELQQPGRALQKVLRGLAN